MGKRLVKLKVGFNQCPVIAKNEAEVLRSGVRKQSLLNNVSLQEMLRFARNGALL